MAGLNQVEIANFNAMVEHIETRPVSVAVERSYLGMWVAYVKREDEYIVGVDLSNDEATQRAIQFIKCVPESCRIPHDDFHGGSLSESL